MEDFKVLGEGTNFTAISTGKFDDLKNYVLPLGEGVFINGKVFTKVLSCTPTRSMKSCT